MSLQNPKIYFGSDLHLDFEKGATHTIDVPEGDILLLPGDIYTPWEMNEQRLSVLHSFLKEVSEKFKVVLMILGNHEHYGGYFTDTVHLVNEHIYKYNNISLLNNTYYQFGNYLIFGSTFWTDANNNDPQVAWDIQRKMNDYHYIKYSKDRFAYNSNTKEISRESSLLLEDTLAENNTAREKLREFLDVAKANNLKPLVLTHHQPSWKCVEGFYRHDIMSFAYANTKLEDLLIDEDIIWVSGHMHKQNVVEIGRTKVFTHARGYRGYETSATNFSFKRLDT